MTILFEIGGAFWWIPQYRKHGNVRRVYWLWFGFGLINDHWGAFLNDYTEAAMRHAMKGKT